MIEPKRPVVITIDGPAGSGKSTVAARLAERLGAAYLDSGAMYRAVTLAAVEQDVPVDDPEAVTELAGRCRIEFARRGGQNRVYLNGRDVTEAVRSPRVSALAHKVAEVVPVRRILGARQKKIARQAGSLVTEGRDQGSVVFPDAAVKFYIDADPAVRARRRWLHLRRQGTEAAFEDILAAQTARDRRDRRRQAAPMKVPDGAVVIDTTGMSVEDVVESLCEYVTEAMDRQSGHSGQGSRSGQGSPE